MFLFPRTSPIPFCWEKFSLKSEKVPTPEKFCENLLVICNEQLPKIGQIFMEEAQPLQTLFMERIFGQSVWAFPLLSLPLFFKPPVVN